MDFVSDMLDKLILDGSVEVAGLDIETSSFVYNFTPKLQENNPELFDSVMSIFYSIVLQLWERGYVDIDLEEEDPMITLTDKGNNLEDLDDLDKMQKEVLKSIVKHFNE
jgi:hypothetical protein